MNRTWLTYSPFIIILLLLFSLAASDVTLREFNAELSQEDDTEVIISWILADNAHQSDFVLKRKLSHENDFSSIATISHDDRQQTPNGPKFVFNDRNVFKQNKAADPVIYALYVKESSELTFVSQTNINVTTTAVRKTWGSIKAMFQ